MDKGKYQDHILLNPLVIAFHVLSAALKYSKCIIWTFASRNSNDKKACT